MRAGARVVAGVLTALLAAVSPAAANDIVLEWNKIALDATVAASQGPVPQARLMAIVHVAIHDAVNAITGEYETYLSHTAPSGATPEAAAIAAAHHALINLPQFVSQVGSLNTLYTKSLAAHGIAAGDAGITFGESVAAAILANRANDGWASAQFAYTAPGAGDPGVWVLFGAAAVVLPGWGDVTPWVIRSASQFRPGEPPSLRSARYTRDFIEVKDLGAADSLVRSDEQTNIARFWLGTPSAIWNGLARQVVDARGLDISDAARAFALLYLAPADSSIACWHAKFFFNYWRPVTAIREADADGNPGTLPDSDWLPLFANPQHPEYPSGHSTNSGAMAAILGALFGDDPGVPLVAASPTNVGFLRNWTNFSEGVDEVIDARIYSGFHYRTSDEVGAQLGRRVAQFVYTHALRPAHGRGKQDR